MNHHYYYLLCALLFIIITKQANALPFFSPNDNNFLNSCWILIIFLKPDYWTLITKRGFDINYELQFYNRFLTEGDNVEHVTWKEIGEDLNLRSPPHESLTLTDDFWSETRLLLWINKQFKTAQTLIVTVGFDYFIERALHSALAVLSYDMNCTY